MDQHGQSAGNPLVRERRFGVCPPAGRPAPRSHTRPLGSRQQASPRHVQIRQPAADIQPVGILRQPTVADFGPPEDPLDDQERMFDFGTDLRLRAIAGPLRLAQRPMAMGFGLDEALGSWGRGAESRHVARYRRHRPTPASPGHAAAPATPGCHAHWPPWPPPNGSAWSGCPRRYGPSCRNTTGCPSWSDASPDPAPSCDSSSNWAH